MNTQSLPYDALFKKIDLFIIQLAVALCVLLDVFQREGNVGIWSALMRVLASALVL